VVGSSGKVRHGGAHPLLELRVDVQAPEDVVEEVLDHPPALGIGQLCQPVHQLHFLS